MTGSRWASAARASAVPLAAVGAAALGATLADALAIDGLDARFLAIAGPIALTLWIARSLRGSRRARIATAALGAPWLLFLFAPPSARLAVIPMTWLSGAILALGIDAVIHAARTAWRSAEPVPLRLALAALGAGPGLYFLLSVAVVVVNTQLIVAPVRLAHTAVPLQDGEREVMLRTADGLRIAASVGDAPPGRPGVVLVHGVADGRSRFGTWAAWLRRRDAAVVRIDVRAHGRSDGSVCTYGQRERLDVLAAVDHLRARGADPIAVVGTSMGGGIVMAAAPELEARGVGTIVALAPASEYRPLVDRRVALLGPLAGPVLNGAAHLATAMGQVPMTEWRPADGLERSRLPVLVMHGTADDEIPIALSERLTPRVELDRLAGVGHVDIPHAVVEHPERRARVFDFLLLPRGR